MSGFGIDLGTANTVVCHQRHGVVLEEPSVLVVRTTDPRPRKVRPLLVGGEARDLMGRCPSGLAAVRPLHDGVIVDLELARAFMAGILGTISTPWWQRIRPRAVIGVPAGATALERRALLEVADGAGVRETDLLPEPIAGAVGCGLDPLEPRAHMVMDIGGGTSEITAFCYGGVLSHRSSRIAGDEMTLALHHYLRSEHQMMVGELAAESLKFGIHGEQGPSMVLQGLDLATGRPRLLTLEAEEVIDALRPTADSIIAALVGALDDLSPQAAEDILTEGVMVFGGTSLLHGFAKLIEAALGFPVRMAERPLTCVAEGAARCLADHDVVRAYEDAFVEGA